MLDNSSLIRINNYIKDMPPLPVSVTKILELSRDPKVDAKILNDVISIDPVLTGKVLKLINSAFYSLPNQVTSLVRAIVLLGINTIKNLVLSAGIMSSINKKDNFIALNMEDFWRHSLCVGAMSKVFAIKQKVDPKLSEEYFVAGLLHDIGKIPFNAVVPEEYKKAMEISERRVLPIYEVETKMFEINHCELGFRIAELWKLPGNIKNTIHYHHNLDQLDSGEKKFVATILLADYVTNRIRIGFSGNYCMESGEEEKLISITGLTPDVILDAEKNAEETVKKAEVFLKLN